MQTSHQQHADYSLHSSMKLIILQECGATGDGSRVVNHHNGPQLTQLWDRRLPPRSRMSAEKGGLMTLTNFKFILRYSPLESRRVHAHVQLLSNPHAAGFSRYQVPPQANGAQLPAASAIVIKRARRSDARRTAHIKDDTSPTCSCR